MVYNGFTSVGSLYQAKCLANNLPVKFKNVKVGDGLVSGQDPTTFTDLLSVKQEVEILSKTQSSNIARLLVQITNDSITTGYQVSEIGIYVEDSDGSEVLYWYINRGAEGSFMPPAATAPTALKYYLNITVTSVDSIVVDWKGEGIWVDYENLGIELGKITDKIPSKVSQLANDTEFITKDSDITGNAAKSTDADKLDGFHGNSAAATNATADPRSKYPLVTQNGIMEIGSTIDMHIYDGRAAQDYAIRIEALGKWIYVRYINAGETTSHDAGTIVTTSSGIGDYIALNTTLAENKQLYGIESNLGIDSAYIPNGHFFSPTGDKGHKPNSEDANLLGINIVENFMWEHMQIVAPVGSNRMWHRYGTGNNTKVITWGEWAEIQQIAAKFSDANGGYIKYTDGTLIQWGYALLAATVVTLSFYTPFVGGQIVELQGIGNIHACLQNRTNNNFSLFAVNFAGVTTTGSIYWFAIGRWL